MNKLLTTALVSAILAAPSFADDGQLAAKNELAITAASASGLKGGSVGVAESGKLYVLGDAKIAAGQKLSLGKDVTVNMGSGTVSYTDGLLTVTADNDPAAVTLTNDGTIVINATDLTKPIKLETIVERSNVQQEVGRNIILNLGGDKTVTYTAATSSYSLVDYISSALSDYRKALNGTKLEDLYGEKKTGTIYNLQSSTSTESLKIGDKEMLTSVDGLNILDKLPKIKYSSSGDDFVKALRKTGASSSTFDTYGIVFSTDGTTEADSKITPTVIASASDSSAISVLARAAAKNLVVLPSKTTITCDSAQSIVCDLTNYQVNADTSGYTSDVKFEGTETLTLSGNVSELKNVTVNCPLKITGTTCPSGEIKKDITFSKTGGSSSTITVKYLDFSSAGKVQINTGVTVEANYVVM